MSFDVCIIGGGIIGLSVAVNVQRLMRLVNVTLIADHLGTDTNTPVAASLFTPAPFAIPDVDPTQAKEWYLDGWNHHFQLATSEEAVQSGNTLQPGTCLWWHEGEHVLSTCVADYRRMTREEMNEKEYNYAKGCRYTTVNIDVQKYLRWLLREFNMNRGRVILDTVFSLQELYGQYDAVVNCVGKRDRELNPDPLFQRVKGSMLQTTLPESEEFIITQDNVYVCPHPSKGLCDVGFIWEKDAHSPSGDVDEVTQWLLQHRASMFVPEIKKCEVVKAWAEKRPSRIPILLDMECLDCGGPILPVVHNVGHGESTVSLAWGRGIQAAHLVQDFRRITRPFARQWEPFKTF